MKEKEETMKYRNGEDKEIAEVKKKGEMEKHRE